MAGGAFSLPQAHLLQGKLPGAEGGPSGVGPYGYPVWNNAKE